MRQILWQVLHSSQDSSSLFSEVDSTIIKRSPANHTACAPYRDSFCLLPFVQSIFKFTKTKRNLAVKIDLTAQNRTHEQNRSTR